MRKPNDWYSMTYEQQREWERNAREVDDLEYRAQRAEQEANDARDAARREARRAP